MILERPECFHQCVDKHEVGLTSSVIIRFCVLYHHNITVTSHSRLWNICDQGVLSSRLSLSLLVYCSWFCCMSKFLFKDMCLIWFSFSVLPKTKVRDKFRKTIFVYWVVDHHEEVNNTSVTRRFRVIYCHRGTVTIQFSLGFIFKPYIIGNRMIVSFFRYPWLLCWMVKFLLSKISLSWFSGSVFPKIKVRYEFIKTGLILSRCWPALRRLNYQCNLLISRYSLPHRNCKHSVHPVAYPQTRHSWW